MVTRDGFVIVGLGWILISLAGALPFVFSGSIPAYVDALFETASGLSTTGASVLSDFDGMPRGVMFWRIFNHWIGGMGVLVFLMAVLPMSGEHSMHIMRAEVPGPTVGKLVPRLKRSARILYMIYIALTIIETAILRCSGMTMYDAVLHAFSTAGTGGFSTMANSITGFQSSRIETILAVFMILFGINFNLYYLILIGSFRKALLNEELRIYLILIALSTAAIAIGLHQQQQMQIKAAAHDAFFNVASIISTTGFGTADFTRWPEFCKWVLILLMFCGGCAGSTGGGMKLSRVMILFKSTFAELKRISRPRNIVRVQMDGMRVADDTVRASSQFAVAYLILLLLFSVLLSVDGVDIITSFTASLSCLSNVGPGMSAAIGPAGSFAIFSTRSKLILSLAMLLGRLEIYPILLLFLPRTWRK
jgi:trk system potassium uptake protein TrkH